MKEDISSQSFDGDQPRSLGRMLQGVQHVGVTVDDMKKSLEFYIEVLGGKLSIAGNGFYGPVLHNTLFEVEDIEAIAHSSSPRSFGVPDLRDGTKDAIDVCFISFGNTCVELIHFREAKLDASAPNIFPRLPSGVGYGNACHISFHVKDDVDLNVFAKTLEEECQRRGITNVKVNHVVDVKTHEERRNLPLKYAANKFWNEKEYFIEGYSDADFGDFEGWSLFYAKGPNGEQLEFNQVTRKAKEHFNRARKEYNEANDTAFDPPRATRETVQEPLSKKT
jgi:catechol 2,3-dioxygenase-like lactoylglutathione lyase family enzyme